ncbi:hypothetical protein BJ741DRAFT_703468 [Chytriomyces cf. hyalinus JEL632]|nr:hypothetical protein BJ741DRAFT_703468 [Chytriomyces cf. hyalinus JEL632]
MRNVASVARFFLLGIVNIYFSYGGKWKWANKCSCENQRTLERESGPNEATERIQRQLAQTESSSIQRK